MTISHHQSTVYISLPAFRLWTFEVQVPTCTCVLPSLLYEAITFYLSSISLAALIKQLCIIEPTVMCSREALHYRFTFSHRWCEMSPLTSTMKYVDESLAADGWITGSFWRKDLVSQLIIYMWHQGNCTCLVAPGYKEDSAEADLYIEEGGARVCQGDGIGMHCFWSVTAFQSCGDALCPTKEPVQQWAQNVALENLFSLVSCVLFQVLIHKKTHLWF